MLADVRIEVDLTRPHVRLVGFPRGWSGSSTTAKHGQTADGEISPSERVPARPSAGSAACAATCAGTPSTRLFAGYAMWNYVSTPSCCAEDVRSGRADWRARDCAGSARGDLPDESLRTRARPFELDPRSLRRVVAEPMALGTRRALHVRHVLGRLAPIVRRVLPMAAAPRASRRRGHAAVAIEVGWPRSRPRRARRRPRSPPDVEGKLPGADRPRASPASPQTSSTSSVTPLITAGGLSNPGAHCTSAKRLHPAAHAVEVPELGSSWRDRQRDEPARPRSPVDVSSSPTRPASGPRRRPAAGAPRRTREPLARGPGRTGTRRPAAARTLGSSSRARRAVAIRPIGRHRSLLRAVATGTGARARSARASRSAARSCARSPLRSRPRPEPPRAAVSSLRGAGRKLAAAAAEIGIETLGDLLRHVPHGYRDRADVARGRRPEDRRGGDGAGRGALGARCGRPGGATCDRRGDGRRRERADEGGLVQPGLAGRAAQPGDTAAAATASSTAAGFRVATHEIVAGGGGARPAGLHTTGIVPVHPPPSGSRAQRLREWAWQAVARAPTRSSRCRPSCASGRGLAADGRRAARRALPGPPEEAERARATGSRSRSSSCTRRRSRSRRGARREVAPGHRDRPAGELVGALARVAALRAHRRTSATRSTRSTPTSRRASRCSGC